MRLLAALVVLAYRWLPVRSSMPPIRPFPAVRCWAPS